MDVYTGQQRASDGNSDFNVMAFVVRMITGQMCTATLARVTAVDPVALTVDVSPMVNQLDGQDNATPHGVIHGVPYVRLQGGNSAILINPVVGDQGLAVFAREDISSVKNNKKPSNPGSRRRYSYADAIYVGGLAILNAAPTQSVKLDAAGIAITAAAGLPVNIVAPGGLTITTPTATFSGDVVVTGHVTTGTGSIFGGRMFDTHIHAGVQAGTANTGGPV